MRLKIWVLFVCLAALPVAALAQGSVNGKWAGEVPGGRGPQQVTLTLKADGGKLSGSVAGGRGGEVPIEEGTIANGMLKFKTKQMDGRGWPGSGAGVHAEAAAVGIGRDRGPGIGDQQFLDP